MAGDGFVSLSEVCQAIVDCEHKTAPIQDTGIPSIRTSDIKNGRIDFRSANRVSEQTYTDWTARREPQPGDIILAREAPVGEVGIIPPNQRACLGQRTVLISPSRDTVDPRYLCYLLVTPEMQHEMICRAEGSTVPHLNMSDIRGLVIPLLPPLPEQKVIAHILGALDDKIELNRRMNETLEATARAIFKSWFVDFDPVRAKLDGQKPVGMDDETAKLFPDSFEDSSIGKVPVGWVVGTVADLAQYINGRNFTKGATGTGRMVIRIAELNSGPGSSTKYNDVEAKPENTAYPDDILFAWSGSLDVYRWHEDAALINQHIFKVLCNGFPKWFVFFHLKEAMPFFQAIAATKATTMGHIKRQHLSDVELAIPPEELIRKADSRIAPICSHVHRNERESRTLAELRDALLPNLLSGEIRV